MHWLCQGALKKEFSKRSCLQCKHAKKKLSGVVSRGPKVDIVIRLFGSEIGGDQPSMTTFMVTTASRTLHHAVVCCSAGENTLLPVLLSPHPNRCPSQTVIWKVCAQNACKHIKASQFIISSILHHCWSIQLACMNKEEKKGVQMQAKLLLRLPLTLRPHPQTQADSSLW